MTLKRNTKGIAFKMKIPAGPEIGTEKKTRRSHIFYLF